MFKVRNIALGLASAIAMMAGANAQAGSMPFMPRGEGVGAPMGFTDLCRRDAQTCGVPESQLALLGITAPASDAPTASVGATWPHRFETSTAAPTDAFEAGLAVLEKVEMLKVAEVSDFVPAGQPRRTTTAAPAMVPIPPTWTTRTERDQLKLVNQINQPVNRDVHSASDMDIYGQPEYWSLPKLINGKLYGDCEDYALEKRRQLIAAGVPEYALSMAVAVTRRGESHAVLMVSLKSGDFVLDNLTPWATPWQDVNYHWVERQVPGTALWTRVV
jgi:predicted transglutaminase-like cysteine proteinase